MSTAQPDDQPQWDDSESMSKIPSEKWIWCEKYTIPGDKTESEPVLDEN